MESDMEAVFCKVPAEKSTIALATAVSAPVPPVASKLPWLTRPPWLTWSVPLLN